MYITSNIDIKVLPYIPTLHKQDLKTSSISSLKLKLLIIVNQLEFGYRKNNRISGKMNTLFFAPCVNLTGKRSLHCTLLIFNN